MPPIKRSWNQDLIQEYIDMLNENMNSRDVVHTAIHNLDRMQDCKPITLRHNADCDERCCQVCQHDQSDGVCRSAMGGAIIIDEDR